MKGKRLLVLVGLLLLLILAAAVVFARLQPQRTAFPEAGGQGAVIDEATEEGSGRVKPEEGSEDKNDAGDGLDEAAENGPASEGSREERRRPASTDEHGVRRPPADRPDVVWADLPGLTDEQKEALAKIMQASAEAMQKLRQDEMDREQRREALRVVMEEQQQKLASVLSAEQLQELNRRRQEMRQGRERQAGRQR